VPLWTSCHALLARAAHFVDKGRHGLVGGNLLLSYI
jgi:hypothetical protein